MRRILLVYPKNPITFWSFEHSLPMARKKSVFPPLGLLTVAGMLPRDWDLRLVDMNVTPLVDEDIAWADAVLTSSMLIHWQPLDDIIARCNASGTPVLCGGPLPTQYHDQIRGDAVFFLGEAENGFLETLEGMCAGGPLATGRHVVDHRDKFLALDQTPLPRWDLVDFAPYVSAMVQITRGCPESCTFCNIPKLYGKTTRLKEQSRAVAELQLLYDLGWRGSVMVVDDNFIGNAGAIRHSLEEDIIPWQEEHGHPFQFHTQVSIRLSDDPELMEAMRRAGFFKIFCGIESPASASLKFMGAQKNLQGKRTLVEKVRSLQTNGFEVQAGFIVGFDTDPDDIADVMIDFIEQAAIPIAMVGILGVVRDTPDYIRFQRKGRLVETVRYTGDTGLFSRNLSYVPLIDPEELYDRHRKVVQTVYQPRNYLERCLATMRHTDGRLRHHPIHWWHVKAMFRSLWIMGMVGPYRWEYWRFLARSARYGLAVRGVEQAIAGHHLIVTTRRAIEVEQVRSFLDEAVERVEDCCRRGYAALRRDLEGRTDWLWQRVEERLVRVGPESESVQRLGNAVMEVADDVARRYRDFQSHLREPLARFRTEVETALQNAGHTVQVLFPDGRREPGVE